MWTKEEFESGNQMLLLKAKRRLASSVLNGKAAVCQRQVAQGGNCASPSLHRLLFLSLEWPVLSLSGEVSHDQNGFLARELDSFVAVSFGKSTQSGSCRFYPLILAHACGHLLGEHIGASKHGRMVGGVAAAVLDTA